MPDYEITIAGRIGPLVASFLPQFHCVATTATVLDVPSSHPGFVLDILRMLDDHHLQAIDVHLQSF